MPLENFFQTYFINPLIYDSGYNLYNSLAYFIFLALFLVYAIPFIFKKLRIEFNSDLIKGIVVYAVFGATLRVLEDLNIIKSILFVSPLIWIFGIILAILLLLLSKFLEQITKIQYYKTWIYSGILLTLIALSQFPFSQISRILILAIFTITWVIPLFILKLKKILYLNNPEIFLPLSAHLLDATATFVSIQYFGYSEKHVLPSFLIESVSPLIMFPLKVIVIWPISIYIYKNFPKERIYLLTAIGLLGLITSVRDILTLLNL